jgi:hypothetical protein
MKIVIFGDSFGDDHINWADQNNWLDVGPSWIDYLRQFHDVDNFCEGGSSLYFSKRIFDNTDLSKYDKVIFLITNSQRRFAQMPGDTAKIDNHWNFSNTQHILEKYKHSPEKTAYLTAMDMFFKYIFNESDEYFHQLMIDDIKRKCPTDFIIDVTYGSVIGSVSELELEYFNNQTFHKILLDGFQDARKCHMSEENNLILGKHMHHCIVNDIYPTLDKSMFINPTRPFEYYFRKS